ncbi:MAG: phosphoribosylaminoimidazolesuccinocarboxamide synthase [Phycisphaerales bacterium JB043]
MSRTSPQALLSTDLALPNRRQGKVRDVYDLEPAASGGAERLLVISTDRLSAFDVVMPTPVPGKGRVLTSISEHWFDLIEREGICQTHRLGPEEQTLPRLDEQTLEILRGRAVVVRACRVVPVECVVRGYLAGSGWVEYQRSQSVCSVALPPGLRQGDRLPEPIFTPATKAPHGEHDLNISFEDACGIAGSEVMAYLRDTSLRVYTFAHEHARARGMILADTKFEFGFPLDGQGRTGGRPVLIDEVLTPDSSRFWPLERWSPGVEQVSFDKQYVREYLLELVAAGRWNKQAPGPELPEEIISNTTARYEEAFRRLKAPPGTCRVEKGTVCQ